MISDGQRCCPHQPTLSQRATLKYFVVVSLLFFTQVMIGGAVAHFRADPASFYGLDLSRIFPSQLLRTWHLQLAIDGSLPLFWLGVCLLPLR